MSIVRAAIGLIKEMESVRNPGEFLGGIRLFTKDLGFEHLTVMRKQAGEPTLKSSLISSDVSESFIADFERLGHHLHNPIVAHAERSVAPFTVTEVRSRRLTSREHDMLDYIHEETGLRDGLIVPLKDAELGDGIVMFAGAKPKNDPLVHSVLNMLGHCVYGHIHDLIRAYVPAAAAPDSAQSSVDGLTPRERECLQWVARGKTDFEIGIILGISARTARFHIENSKRKLGVASRVQAVTAAMKTGSIAAL